MTLIYIPLIKTNKTSRTWRFRYGGLMPPYMYDDRGRRVAVPSKGELRERSILNEAEKQLRDVGPDAMTVESIANAAGINRASLYFYFRSKNDVLAALVERVVNEMVSGVATSDRTPDAGRSDGASSAAAISEAIRRTALLWKTHGAVLRAAVDLAPSVEVIAELWNDARSQIADSAAAIIASQMGLDPELEGRLPEAVRALVAMTEREFYTASASDGGMGDAGGIDRTLEIVELIWRRTFRLT